jgi:hypothetical protein
MIKAFYGTFRYLDRDPYKDMYIIVHAENIEAAHVKLRGEFGNKNPILFPTRALARVDEYELTLLEEIR